MSAVSCFALLCAAFIVKHVLADFVLQTQWIWERKESLSGWAAPLAAHCGWHAGITAIIVLVVVPRLWWLAVIDFVLHAAIDRGKGVAVAHWRIEPMKEKRWWLIFGIDQGLHQLTHVGSAYLLLVARQSSAMAA